MLRKTILLFITPAIGICVGLTLVFAGTQMSPPSKPVPPPSAKSTASTTELPVITLPVPATKGTVSLEETVQRRRSIRSFAKQELILAQIGQLAWAAQGVSDRENGLRTTPSAGALYPLKLYVVKADGVFLYQPLSHTLQQLATEDRRGQLAKAALDQTSVHAAPVDFVITGTPAKLKEKYGDRADRFICLEAGHAAQNMLLQAVSLGLGGVPVGAFTDTAVAQVLSLPTEETPLYILPLGFPIKQE